MTNTPTNPEPTTNPTGFRASPDGHVYGILDDPQTDIPAVTADLLAEHMPLDGIHIYCCSEGVDALDLTGTRHSGHDVVYYGGSTWQRLGPQGSASAPKD